MGLAIDRDRFEAEEYGHFSRRLDECLTALRELLLRPGFGEGPLSLGAELEVSLVDAGSRPLHRNQEVLAETRDARMTVELDRFNLEANLRHAPLAGDVFRRLADELHDALGELRRAARVHGGRVVPIGILPTLAESDLQSSAMTDIARFRALAAALQGRRRGPFHLLIDGADPLDIVCDDVTFEGAATSLQIHLRLPPARFASVYDAIQMATAPVLAVSGNSPFLLGHRLWEETRVALFKQAVDDRDSRARRARRQSRVSFGSRWLRDDAYALFAEAVAEHAPLLPVMSDEDPLECVRAGHVPKLEEIRLHQGTVWTWNRAIYDPSEGGHLRVEMRSLPSGPTTEDMLANTAVLVGLGLGLASDHAALIRAMPFEVAERNFYRAAKEGLEARLHWPTGAGRALKELSACSLFEELLPSAAAGLGAAGVSSSESRRLLGIVAERARSGRTGAAWQRRCVAALEAQDGRPRALAEMLERYQALSLEGRPVHTWEVEA